MGARGLVGRIPRVAGSHARQWPMQAVRPRLPHGRTGGWSVCKVSRYSRIASRGARGQFPGRTPRDRDCRKFRYVTAESVAARTRTPYNSIESVVSSETTYTSLRENLASVLDQVVDQKETVIVRRRGARRRPYPCHRTRWAYGDRAPAPVSSKRAPIVLGAAPRESGNVKPGTVGASRKKISGETRS